MESLIELYEREAYRLVPLRFDPSDDFPLSAALEAVRASPNLSCAATTIACE